MWQEKQHSTTLQSIQRLTRGRRAEEDAAIRNEKDDNTNRLHLMS